MRRQPRRGIRPGLAGSFPFPLPADGADLDVELGNTELASETRQLRGIDGADHTNDGQFPGFRAEHHNPPQVAVAAVLKVYVDVVTVFFRPDSHDPRPFRSLDLGTDGVQVGLVVVPVMGKLIATDSDT